MPQHLFVYGSLKRGGSNHALIAAQRFIATARTQPCYKLYALSGFPGMVAVEQDGRSIQGEIWEVDELCLADLDLLEGTAEGIYARERIKLLPPHETLEVEGYLYLFTVAGRTELDDTWPV